MAKTPKSAPKTPEPELKARHVIRSVEMTSGFLKGTKLVFLDGLNVIIGGRGNGKSTIIELISHAFGLGEKRTATRGRTTHDKLVKENLEDGPVRLNVATRHGVSYVVERGLNEEARVFDDQGGAMAGSLVRDLAAAVYSVDEIEEIAIDPDLQLQLLDGLLEDDARQLAPEILRLQEELERNALILVALDRQVADFDENAPDIAALEKELAAFQSAGGQAGSLDEAHRQKVLRDREKRALDVMLADVRRVRQDLGGMLAGLVRRLDTAVPPDLREAPNRIVLDGAAETLAALRASLERAAERSTDDVNSAEAAFEEHARALAARHATQDAEYHQAVAALQEESGRAAERSRLQKRLADAAEAKQKLDRARVERRDQQAVRTDLTKSLKALREERLRRRQEIATKLTKAHGPTIKVEVIAQGARAAYRELLGEALKGLKQGGLVERIVKYVPPEELARLIARSDVERMVQRLEIEEGRAHRIIEALRGTSMLYAIEAVELGDLPRFSLLTGKDYRGSEDLSTGQRCSAILPILLEESDRPLLIDQPEDNLDNKYIYETVVRTLERTKKRRQFIFVTHNPNVPVLADAERVFVLESDGSRGWVAKEGTVDELKGEIESILDGGRDAFLLRKQRYGH